MRAGTVYVIGAGIAGLSAAAKLAQSGAKVCLLEGTSQAGGRCRSYLDPSLGHVIDNGNHLVLSGNHSVAEYVKIIGAENALTGPDTATFAFADVKTSARWKISPNDGALPWWVFVPSRRVPNTTLSEYVALAKLLAPSRGKRIGEVVSCKGALWHNLLHPLLLAALNTEPAQSSADLAATVIRETLAKGGRAYRPRIATPSLSAAFIDPALAFLKSRNAEVRFGRRLRGLQHQADKTAALDFGDEQMSLSPDDRVILATPPWATQELIPDVAAPNEFRAIVNAHFIVAPPPKAEPMVGVINGAAQWVFAFPDRISVTVSGADDIVDSDREALAASFWHDIAAIYGLGVELPPWQIVKERRATFAATPEQAARRAKPNTRWTNLFLAGDWTDTGLPATIEGAVRSGFRAADLALA